MSAAEDALAFQLRAVGIRFDREVLFARVMKRRWRADFVVSACGDRDAGKPCDYASHTPLLVEVDGGTWTSGRHTTGSGFARDAEKLNRATELGYRVLRFTPAMVDDGSALAQIERCLA